MTSLIGGCKVISVPAPNVKRVIRSIEPFFCMRVGCVLMLWCTSSKFKQAQPEGNFDITDLPLDSANNCTSSATFTALVVLLLGLPLPPLSPPAFGSGCSLHFGAMSAPSGSIPDPNLIFHALLADAPSPKSVALMYATISDSVVSCVASVVFASSFPRPPFPSSVMQPSASTATSTW